MHVNFLVVNVSLNLYVYLDFYMLLMLWVDQKKIIKINNYLDIDFVRENNYFSCS